ncbi:3-mercaptopyruvate sulfurtransferase [Streptomyces malaysiensis subsp. malaysiensis]|nr:3-mercaptopyruvate sulfurtransferase [Streptomyces sp. M56]
MSAVPETSHITIGVAELADRLRDSRRPVLLDVRYDPQREGSGHAAFAQGHIPGAVHVDLPGELARPGRPEEGRHPLPEPSDLQASARRWGINEDSDIVVYDARAGLSAGRAWWLLRWAGLESVRILDGGLGAWTAAGHPLSLEPSAPLPGDVVLTPGRLPVIDADQAAEYARRGLLFDARGTDAYERGHIPGALSLPAAANLGEAGTLLAPEALRARYAALLPGGQPQQPPGPAPFAVYCGSGVAAAFQVSVLAALDIPVALYPGSWSAWSADPRRETALGPGPDPADLESGG